MRMTMMLTKMRMMTDDFPKNPLLHYGRPISGRDNLHLYGRVSGKGVEMEALIFGIDKIECWNAYLNVRRDISSACRNRWGHTGYSSPNGGYLVQPSGRL